MTYNEWTALPCEIWLEEEDNDPDRMPRLSPPEAFHYQEWWLGSADDLDPATCGQLPRFFGPACYPSGVMDGAGTSTPGWRRWI